MKQCLKDGEDGSSPGPVLVLKTCVFVCVCCMCMGTDVIFVDKGEIITFLCHQMFVTRQSQSHCVCQYVLDIQVQLEIIYIFTDVSISEYIYC